EQRIALEAASDFCLNIGQKQIQILDRGLQSGALPSEPMPLELQWLVILGENLRNAGEVLSWIGRPTEGEKASRKIHTPSIAALIGEVWKEVSEELALPDIGLLEIKGDCRVPASAENLEIAIARILRWLTERVAETPAGVRPALTVHCRPMARGPEIDFRDRSRRLPESSREKLFSPFGGSPLEDPESLERYPEFLGLYLSKVLIEKEHGYLEDRTDEDPVEGNAGHRFVMRFPQPETSGTAL
ncbi:MAG TPA: hypothetical protein VGR07_19135, partial [Thermoanaerobaculia bacterium]|nr:hypothetical protein [Thermoanaerobaculia bacterium]